MNDQDYKYLEDMLKSTSGLIITREKMYLLESRLLPLARDYDLHGLEALVSALRTGRHPDLRQKVIDAMTTNETSFFRDKTPFDLLMQRVLPPIMENRKASKKLRIWSAACSSGQEPYSIAMLMKEEAQKFAGWNVEIVATDIAQHILDTAQKGIYSQFEVQRGMPIQMLVKYFSKKEDKWEIKPEIKSMITFKKFNLLENMAVLGKFDIVFCRNVLIYFDVPTKGVVLSGINKVLQPDGALFLGGAETVMGITSEFRMMPDARGVYLPVSDTVPQVQGIATTR